MDSQYPQGGGDVEIRTQLERRKRRIYTTISSLDTEDLMEFAQHELSMDPLHLDLHYQQGQLDEETRHSQLQLAYRQDREGFLYKFPQDFGDTLRGVQQNTEPPNELPSKSSYDYLRKYKRNWLKHLRQNIGLNISDQEVRLCNRHLSRRQKTKLLDSWLIQQGGLEQETLENLDGLFHIFRQRQREENSPAFEQQRETSSVSDGISA